MKKEFEENELLMDEFYLTGFKYYLLRESDEQIKNVYTDEVFNFLLERILLEEPLFLLVDSSISTKIFNFISSNRFNDKQNLKKSNNYILIINEILSVDDRRLFREYYFTNILRRFGRGSFAIEMINRAEQGDDLIKSMLNELYAYDYVYMCKILFNNFSSLESHDEELLFLSSTNYFISRDVNLFDNDVKNNISNIIDNIDTKDSKKLKKVLKTTKKNIKKFRI